jgi:hypothetical protein
VLIDPTLVGLVRQEPEVLPSESTGPIQEAGRLDRDMLPSSEDHNDGMGDPIVEHSPVVDEGLTPSSSEEHVPEVGRGITSSGGSLGLSSPTPWEQIENITIGIAETAPLVQSDGAPLLGGEAIHVSPATPQPEFVSDQLSRPAPPPDLTEPRESIFAAEPSTNHAVLQEPEVPVPSDADSSPVVPFSWNAVFDGALKLAAGTLSSSSPAALSKPDTKELESVQPESVSEPEPPPPPFHQR